MTFTPITSIQGSKREQISISCRLKHGHPRVRVTMRPEFVKQIGWADGVRLQPYLGSGPDDGYLRLKLVTSGGVRLNQVPNSVRLAVEFTVPGLTETCDAREPECRPDVLGKALTIRLPWADMNNVVRVA